MASKPPPSKGRPTRRQFVSGVLLGAAAGCSSAGQKPADGSTGIDATGIDAASGAETTPRRKTAADQVILGSTGIRVSRLAMGSGTHGAGKASDQTRIGLAAFDGLFGYGFSKGLTFFDTADDYGAHTYVRDALKTIGRQNVVLLTKSLSQTAAAMQADLDRFRTELGTDMIDIVLLHGKESPTWTTECQGAMDALESAKAAGVIRAHGVSCHTIEALRLAAQTPWVDIDLARINPAGIRMDADPATVLPVLRSMRAAGKGVIGMKILGEGQLANDLDTALGYAMGLDAIDAFSIGFTSQSQLDQVMQKIAAVG